MPATSESASLMVVQVMIGDAVGFNKYTQYSLFLIVDYDRIVDVA